MPLARGEERSLEGAGFWWGTELLEMLGVLYTWHPEVGMVF
jgi:hypothetical protein